MSANFFHLQPSILSLTATPTCCCLYSTGVWKQAPTHFLSLFRQAVWHPAYHLPQDFMLRIIQLLVCVINCLLCPTECQALAIDTVGVMPHQLTWERPSFRFHNRTGPWKALKDLAYFYKLLILLKDSKISKTTTIYIHENLSWKQNQTQEPRLQVAPSFDEKRSKQDFGNRSGS